MADDNAYWIWLAEDVTGADLSMVNPNADYESVVLDIFSHLTPFQKEILERCIRDLSKYLHAYIDTTK